MEKRKSVAPFYAVAILWLLYALIFPLYSVTHYVIVAVVSLIVFAVVSALCNGSEVIGGEEQAKAAQAKTAQPKAAEKPKEESTGNAELDKTIKDIRLAISEMKRLDEAIEDAEISADIVRLEEVSEGIVKAVKHDPKKLPQIRRFMDYYLPTTLKLLNSYDRMSGTGVSGGNISTAMSRVEDIMHTIVAAFEKQLDSLYGSDALDISADIQVMETMLKTEGLSGQEMQADAVQADPTDIKLEL